MKPYRSIDFNDERKWKSNHYHDDVTQVGIKKAMGYTCEIGEDTKEKLQIMQKDFILQGKLTSYQPKGFRNGCPFLYVGDEKMIQEIIDKHKFLLLRYRWKLNSKFVFNKIATTSISHQKHPKMYHFICDLFNSWCLHCEDLVINKTNKELPYFLSVHPHNPDGEN